MTNPWSLRMMRRKLRGPNTYGRRPSPCSSSRSPSPRRPRPRPCSSSRSPWPRRPRPRPCSSSRSPSPCRPCPRPCSSCSCLPCCCWSSRHSCTHRA
ncbi:TPA: hypothetical protein JAJ64_002743 [Corynebacterium striatum]|nr:hypothetical protein [Corynebacterium striatum]HAT6488276.1 hypothetical protein [Corynebacterium striatum]